MNICACLGPQNGEPHCMCQMINSGLRTAEDYAMKSEDTQKFNEALRQIFSKE